MEKEQDVLVFDCEVKKFSPARKMDKDGVLTVGCQVVLELPLYPSSSAMVAELNRLQFSRYGVRVSIERIQTTMFTDDGCQPEEDTEAA